MIIYKQRTQRNRFKRLTNLINHITTTVLKSHEGTPVHASRANTPVAKLVSPR